MKKLFAFFLLSIYLISLTELHQLAKLPLLIEHYAEHKSKENKLTLSAFLFEHYVEMTNDGDRDKDMKLPFKSNDNCIGTNITVFSPTNNENLIAKPEYTESKVYTIYSEKFLSSAYLASIWQPPKSC